jgi:hypothetical protein
MKKGMYKVAGPDGRRKFKEQLELNTMDKLGKMVEKAVEERQRL